jgi:hypothetical protein
LRRRFTFPFFIGWSFILPQRCWHCTFFQFHYQPPLLLNTHGHEFIDWPFVFICFILYVKGYVLLWESIHNIVHKKKFWHLNLKILHLSHNVSHLHDVLAHISHTSEPHGWELHDWGAC